MIESSRYNERRLRLLAQEVAGRTVLDLGYAQTPNRFLRAVYRTGVDLARPAGGPPVYEEEIQGDVTELPSLLPARSFDTVICGELIEHLENPYALLRDIRSLLNPGGRLLVSTPNPLSFPLLPLELVRCKRYFYTEEHRYYFTPRWVERLITATGFRILRLRAVGIWALGSVIPFPILATSYQVIYVAERKE